MKVEVRYRQVNSDHLPITIIVPRLESRDGFYKNFCLDSIIANRPREILEVSGEGGASAKRNYGLKHAGQDLVFFCDDDVVLAKNCLQTLFRALAPRYRFAYCDNLGICVHPEGHPNGGVFVQRGHEFQAERFYEKNYASTMSLVRKFDFPGFDESLPRFHDWDVWLTMIKEGARGIYVPEVLFHAYYLDIGVTAGTPYEEALKLLKQKHPDITA